MSEKEKAKELIDKNNEYWKTLLEFKKFSHPKLTKLRNEIKRLENEINKI